MRDLQIGVVHDFVAGENQIQIECARRAWVRTPAACLSFDRAQRLEDLARRTARCAYPDRIQIWWIVLQSRADWCRFDDLGKGEVREQFADGISGRENRRPPIAEVGAEGDDDRPILRFCD